MTMSAFFAGFTIMARSHEDRDLSDERILGGGDFVESVLRESDNRSDRGRGYGCS